MSTVPPLTEFQRGLPSLLVLADDKQRLRPKESAIDGSTRSLRCVWTPLRHVDGLEYTSCG